MVLALMAVSHTRWLILPAQVFIDVFRGLPAALVILLVGQGLAPVGLAIFGPNPYPLAIVALGLISSAYIAEIFPLRNSERGARTTVRVSGARHDYWSSMRHVIVPQGVRRILPALANQFISIVKDSSLVYFLGLLTSQRDLFTIGQNTSVNTANLSPLVAAGRRVSARHHTAHARDQSHRPLDQPACESGAQRHAKPGSAEKRPKAEATCQIGPGDHPN